MKELNAKTNAETKNQQVIDESDIHQLTLEDRYYCLRRLKYNPLRPKILLTRAPVQTEARHPLNYQKKHKISKHRASVQTEARRAQFSQPFHSKTTPTRASVLTEARQVSKRGKPSIRSHPTAIN